MIDWVVLQNACTPVIWNTWESMDTHQYRQSYVFPYVVYGYLLPFIGSGL